MTAAVHPFDAHRNSAVAPSYVVAIGGANLDVMARSHGPLVPQDSNPGHVRTSPGGVARNVAENLVRLGCTVEMLTLLGDDDAGRALLRHARQLGMGMQGTRLLPHARTASYVCVQGPQGDMEVAINDMDILEQLGPSALLEQQGLLLGAQCWVVDCNVQASALQALFDMRSHRRQISPAAPPVLVDAVSVAKCERLRPHLDQIHTLKANRHEAAVLAGFPVESVAEAKSAAQALCGLGVGCCVISLGNEGLVWCEAGLSAVHRAAPAMEVVSTTGAGDALLAGLVDAWRLGLDAERSIAWAMACAEITLLSESANAPDLSAAAVERRVLNHDKGSS